MRQRLCIMARRRELSMRERGLYLAAQHRNVHGRTAIGRRCEQTDNHMFAGDLALIVKGSSTLTKPLGSKFTYLLKNKSGIDESHSVQLSNDFLNFKRSKGQTYDNVPPNFYLGNEEEFGYNIAQGRITYCKVTDSLISDLESRIVVVEFKLVQVINP